MKSQRNKEITTATLRLEMPPAPNANAVDTPSYAPGDRSITFKPDNGEPVINTFTVRSAYITAAYKGYGSVTDDDVRASLKPPPWGLLLPPAARSIDLHDFVSLPGDKILSLEGTDGPYGIWDMDAPYSGMWVLFPGESLTNNLPENMVIEFYGGVTPVTATLTYTFRGTGVASNYSYSATLKITTCGVRFVEDSTTRYNFSPSLEETAEMRVEVVSPSGTNVFHNCTFQIEIVRELSNGTIQRIDWVNVQPEQGPGTYYNWRDVDFSSEVFTWNGIPSVPFGQTVSISTGRDVFQGLSENVNIKFPAVTAGKPVPPPFYTAVARIRQGNTTLCETRKRIFVPQVVKMVYEADAVTQLCSNVVSGTSVVLFNEMNTSQWLEQKGRIKTIAQGYFDGINANVRFCDDTDTVVPLHPYSEMRMVAEMANIYGMATTDFLNTNPSDQGTLFSAGFHQALYNHFREYPYSGPPITHAEMGFLWGNVVSHETGHLLGLVWSGGVLDGDTGNHNKNPSSLRIMNDGLEDSLLDNVGRHGSWYWRLRNAQYLQFILKKEGSQ